MLHMLVDVFLCKFELDNKSCDSLFDSKPTLWERSERLSGQFQPWFVLAENDWSGRQCWAMYLVSCCHQQQLAAAQAGCHNIFSPAYLSDYSLQHYSWLVYCQPEHF